MIKQVQEPWFSLIETGKKKVEGRLNKGVFKNLSVGDIIIWENNNKHIKTIVISVHHHKNFRNMLMQQRLFNVLPGVRTLKQGLEIYSKFYSDSDILEHGVLAIRIKII